MSHDQLTRYLSAREYTSKDLWGEVKATIRQIEQEDGCLIFDDTIQENAWKDGNEIMCWHYDHYKGRSEGHQPVEYIVPWRGRVNPGRL